MRWILVPLFALLIGGCNDLKKDIPIITTVSPVAISEQLQSEDLSLEDIIALNHGDVEIIRDPATDIPRQINGIFTTRSILSEEDAVLALLSVRGILGIESSNFACIDIDDSRENLRVFSLEQLHNGLSVWGGGFRVTASKTGAPVSVGGTFQRGIEIETTPRLDEQEACKRVTLKSGQKTKKVQLMVFTAPDSEPRLSWQIVVGAKNPLDEKLVMVDALSGSVLAEYPLAID
ncbi:MAG: hypothetical protein LBP73_00835 [Clostridiales Family XIII bacterium]|nr:hypothetical protein [Clostridiales Family XIII bacterium]